MRLRHLKPDEQQLSDPVCFRLTKTEHKQLKGMIKRAGLLQTGVKADS